MLLRNGAFQSVLAQRERSILASLQNLVDFKERFGGKNKILLAINFTSQVLCIGLSNCFWLEKSSVAFTRIPTF